MFQIKYRGKIQFLSCFIWHFVNPNEMETGPETGPETEMEMGCLRLVVVFSLGSPSQ